MRKILVAVSGGPDSMALLHILAMQDFDIIAAHVNYQVRDTSHIDEAIIRDFCQKHNIDFRLLKSENHSQGNFQAFARDLRYQFMVDIADEENIDDIFVAHHLDDHLETYLIQKDRNITPSYYGLNYRSKYQDKNIIRPLLDYTKADLLDYCEENDIKYAIDKSNFENVYLRNKIRNTVLNQMSDEKKALLLKEISDENDLLMDINAVTNMHLSDFEQSNSLDYLLSLPDFYLINTIRMYLTKYSIYDISNEEYENILLFLKSDKNSEYDLDDDYILSKAYGKVTVEKKQESTYSYTFNEIKEFECDHFSLKFEGSSTEALTLFESDFPITIRNYQKGDYIEMKYGRKKLSRFFIDRKIPTHLRSLWPIVENVKGEIILVAELGCNLSHFSNNPSVFVVK